MPSITIDEKYIEINPTDTILTAAQRAGIEIPHFCYHPELRYVGSCRMCMVEVEKSPKLLTSCTTLATEGMVVKTQSEKVKKARKAVLEFLLVNHPLDCPICDKAGECPLQDNYFKFSTADSRFLEYKWHKGKRINLGPTIIHDEERCILCTRCVRFMEDFAKSPQLIVARRGHKNILTTYPNEPFNNPYSLNTVDICPVGALTSKDFRFKCRVWFLKSTYSICPFCETGCNIIIQHKDDVIYRIIPFKNEKVNRSFMCDYGRLLKKYVNLENRIKEPFIHLNKFNTNLTPTPKNLNEILIEISEKFKKLLKNNESNQIGIILSPYLSSEEAYLILQMFSLNLKITNISLLSYKEGLDDFKISDDILISQEKSPNYNGINKISQKLKIKFCSIDELINKIKLSSIKLLLFIGPSIGLSDILISKFKDEFKLCNTIVSITTHYQDIALISDYVLPFALWAENEGHFINKNNITQKFNIAVNKYNLNNFELIKNLAKHLKLNFKFENLNDVSLELINEKLI